MSTAGGDATLLKRLKTDPPGCISALEEMMALYTSPLLRFARSFAWDSAEDIVQETFIDIWTSRHKLDLRGSLRGYLFGTVRRKALLAKRHDSVVERNAEIFGIGEESPGFGAPTASPYESLTESDLQAALGKALETIPERTRSVLTLRWVHDLSYPEIAAALGISQDAAKKQGQRGEIAIRPLLESFKNS